MKCGFTCECPDLFEKEDGAFIAIGRKLNESETEELKITDKIAEDEVASELPREVVLNALKLPKWDGGFEQARKIAWNILDTCRGPRGLNDFDNMAFIEKLSEALVEAYDSGVAAEHFSRQKPRERLREQIAGISAALDEANKSGLREVLIDSVTWTRHDVGSYEADLIAARNKISELTTQIDILKSRESD